MRAGRTLMGGHAILLALMVMHGRAHAASSSDAAAVPARPLLPGIGSHDARTRLDPNRKPWRAVGKLQATAGNLHISCTGTLIGPATVLTAAHCLFNIRTQRYFPPSSLHFLIGYERGAYAGHAGVRALTPNPDYDPRQPIETLGSDWAVVTIDAELGAPGRTLTLLDRTPAIGTPVMIGGYSQDHAYELTGDVSCRVVGEERDPRGQRLLRHDCSATHGESGGPLLTNENGTWCIAGIDVAARATNVGGIAVFPHVPETSGR
jgi:protease YdgD